MHSIISDCIKIFDMGLGRYSNLTEPVKSITSRLKENIGFKDG
jgi:hypothetical protein